MDVQLQEGLEINTIEMQKAARLLRAINHSLRQQILAVLHKNEKMTVTELYIDLRLEQSVASQHLAILRQAGVVTTQRRMKNVFYSVNYQRLHQLHMIAFNLITNNT